MRKKWSPSGGMSDKVGPLNLGRGEEHPFLGRELAQPKRYSEGMAWLMDQEIRNLIKQAQATAEKILSEKKETLDKLAEGLLKEESLDYGQIEKIIGAPKAKPEAAPTKKI